MIDAPTGLFNGFVTIFSPQTAFFLIVGIVLGYFVGALPGLTSSMGMALLIPFTFAMDPVPAIVMLVVIYSAADYAAGIPAILVNAPGQPAAAVTAFDGYPMRRRGETGKALTLSLMSSGIGSLIAGIFLVVTAEVMADVALAFGPAEYFSLAVLGLSLVSALSMGFIIRSIIGMLFGLLVLTIGIDPVSGAERFVLHIELIEGIPFLPALIGLFALSEVFYMLEEVLDPPKPIKDIPKIRGSFGVLRPYPKTVLKSSVIGYFVGVIPGAGSSIASLVSYGVAKRSSKEGHTFGEGNPEGIVASETANNASVCGALAPLLALGIPGSASTAILIGGLTIQGLQPGPLLFVNNPEIPYSIFASLLAGIPIMVILGLFGVRLWVGVTTIPKGIVATVVAGICILGAYASTNSVFTIGITVFFGIIGYIFRKMHINPAPIVLALVLGVMMETNFRRAMIMSGDDLIFFLTKPISAVLLVMASIVLLFPLLQKIIPRQNRGNASEKSLN
jgi:putative tricarboxylic transport membrane protein